MCLGVRGTGLKIVCSNFATTWHDDKLAHHVLLRRIRINLGQCSNDISAVDVAWRFEHFNLDLLKVAWVSLLLVSIGWRRAVVGLGKFSMV